MAERVGPEPGCLADPCPACEPAARPVAGTYQPPVEVSDFDVACYLGALLGRLQPQTAKTWSPRERDEVGGQLRRIGVAFERGGGLGVFSQIKDELSEARRRELAGAVKTFARIQRGADL